SRSSASDLASLTPPALPRPPVWTWAFTTTGHLPSDLPAATASSTVDASMPRGTGTPKSPKSLFAWNSWMFMEGCWFSVLWHWGGGAFGGANGKSSGQGGDV